MIANEMNSNRGQDRNRRLVYSIIIVKIFAWKTIIRNKQKGEYIVRHYHKSWQNDHAVECRNSVKKNCSAIFVLKPQCSIINHRKWSENWSENIIYEPHLIGRKNIFYFC